MDFDTYESPQTEHLLRVATDRWILRAPRTVMTELTAAVVVLVSAALLATLVGHPYSHLHLVDVMIVVGLFLVCQRVSFPVGPAHTAPTQLAFVPMLLLLPTALVPLVVICCQVASILLPGRLGKPSGTAVIARIADCGFALGPVLVLVLAHTSHFSWSYWPIYTAAMAAQVLTDLAFGLGRSWFADRIPPREQLPVLGWLYLTDICLTCVALFVDASAQYRPGLVLLILPLVGLLALFARERQQRMEGSLELSSAYRGAATLLGDVLDDDDPYTGVHSREVADMALAVAVALDLSPVTLFNVEYGGLLHDVGKIRVPKAILQKAGQLSPEEWQVMRQHTVAGEEMLCMVGGSLSGVGRIVRHSHERYDGTGYPDGLAGAAIPIESRVVSVCDAWNAMTTSRPYRRALSVEVAADEMKRCSGVQFDPIIVDALMRDVIRLPYWDGVLAPHAYRSSDSDPVRS